MKKQGFDFFYIIGVLTTAVIIFIIGFGLLIFITGGGGLVLLEILGAMLACYAIVALALYLIKRKFRAWRQNRSP